MKNRQVFKWIINIISLTAIAVLISPPFPKILFYYVLGAIALSCVKSIIQSSLKMPGNNISAVIFSVSLLILAAGLFYERWIHSSKLAYIASAMGMNISVIVLLITMILGVMAFYTLYPEVIQVTKQLEKHSFLKLVVITGLLSLIQFFQMQYSSLELFDLVLQVTPLQFATSVCFLFAINYLVGFLIWKKYGLVVTSVFFTGWCIANYYVIEFHGSPLYFNELASLKTGIAVIGGYKFKITQVVFMLIVCFICELSAVFSIKMDVFSVKGFQKLSVVLATIGFSIIGIGMQLDRAGAGWSWKDNIIRDGYVLSFIRDMNIKAESIIMPSDYDPNHLNYESPDFTDNMNRPDIIVILNETFCDLNYYSGIEMDSAFFEKLYNTQNAIIGNAITPAIGGGTNLSEFELMTAKSTNLLPSAAPYLYFSSEIAGRSFVDYFNTLGYFTIGMHCGLAENYSRNTVYPAMGFDDIYLGESEYKYFNKNGNRIWLDKDNYRDLIEHYENSPAELPRFMYLLTFQNHGGWEQNEDELDTVHVTGDYGDLTDDINEYCSSVQLSVNAFNELTEYFMGVDRQVIVCMVGDHAPSFISKLENACDYPDYFGQRVVPYIIWSNYKIQTDFYNEYSSITDLLPVIINSAGLPNTAFTQTILSLHEQYPVRLKNGMVLDRNGVLAQYDESDAKYEKLNQYYCLEYNSLSGNNEYKENLFLPSVK